MNTDTGAQAPSPELRKVSSYEFAMIEGASLWAKLREPKNIGADSVLIAGAVLVLAGVVFEGASLIARALAEKTKQ